MSTNTIYSQNFLNKSNIIHNNKYDYSNVKYNNARTKVEIICKTHGVFYQTPKHHTSGCGCPKCGKIIGTKKKTKTTPQFINDANNIHKGRYNYSNSIYTGVSNGLEIICHVHGSFIQKPSHHLAGSNCPECSRELYSFGYHTPRNAKDADFIYYIYTIKLTNNEETFYKTGITHNLQERHNNIHSKTGYKIELLDFYISTKFDCNSMEKLFLKNKQRRNKYEPKIKFDGWTECYS